MEIWKDIEGYEGYYQVSTEGRIRSLDRRVWNGRGYILLEGKLVAQTLKKDGYLKVKLNKEGEHKHFLVHRLVAQAFIPNPDNLPSVNHKDENKTNNSVENLEWCTVAYNNSYGDRLKHLARSRGKKVAQIKDGEVIATYYSCVEAAKQINGHNSRISECARGLNETAYGYKWRYV